MKDLNETQRLEINKLVAEKLNVECGMYRHIAVHPHIYVNRDKDELKKFGY